MLGISGLNGIYHKQGRHMAVAGRPLYIKNDDDNTVIAWDGRWKHWWITDKENMGTNSGYAYFQQDQDDHCPGFGDVTIRRAGTDLNIPSAKIEVLEDLGTSEECFNDSELLRLGGQSLFT